MKTLTKAALLTGALALAACTNAGRFDSAAPGSGGTGTDTTGAAANAASDPRSPAYFQTAIGDRVLFAVDQSTLTPEARATLDGQAGWLLTNTEYLAVIEGHADEQGTRDYNLGLGARRASAVRDYLVSKGVPDARLRTVSYGKERPIEICSAEACYAKNRRAVTIISAGGLTS